MRGTRAPHREGRELDEATAPGAGRPVAGGSVEGRPALPVLDDDARSPDPAVCPFFRLDTDGVLSAPRTVPDEDNRCIAIAGPRAQSLQQQDLVCLRTAHADCPRYLRGSMSVDGVARTPRRPAALPRATLAAILLLVVSAGISFGFVLARGGIDLPVAGASPAPSAAAVVATPSPSPVEPSATVPATAEATPEPSGGASPSPTPAPTPAPSSPPTPAATAGPTPTPAAGVPSASRLSLLTPCPGQSGCYIYVVRSGDNLFSIANYFGVPLATVKAWNPAVSAGALRAGQQLKIPTPTR